MKTLSVPASVTNTVNQPTIEDYNSECPRMPCNTPKKEVIFKILTKPENIHNALIIAAETKNSPITSYRLKFQEAIDNGEMSTLENPEKQFIGSVIRVIMEENDFQKTGRKQRFTEGLFTSAEIYEK